jgi:hypothetical protein
VEALGASRLVAEGQEAEEPSAVFNLRGALGRALEKLAVDLYSSSASVLFELIANADDANYGNSDAFVETPTVVVSSRGDGFFRFSSNEDGLTSKNVTAMSDIGASTKTSGDLADISIGHKGVGFKSVFLLSDQPLVASFGLNIEHEDNTSFKFDCVKNGLFGLLVPEWVRAESFDALWAPSKLSAPIEQLEPDHMWSNRGTRGLRILLPLKKNAILPSLAIDPIVLLLLRKVRKIVLDTIGPETPTQRRTVTMEGNLREVSLPNADGHNELRLRRGVVKIIQRIEVDGLTELSETIHEFLLSSTKLGNIELTLIFPTVDNKEASQQQCFCFLPVQRTGLRFGVHSDGWKLTASRQEIHQHDPLNLALRGQIPKLFVATLRASEELRHLSGVFVPSPNSLKSHPW